MNQGPGNKENYQLLYELLKEIFANKNSFTFRKFKIFPPSLLIRKMFSGKYMIEAESNLFGGKVYSIREGNSVHNIYSWFDRIFAYEKRDISSKLTFIESYAFD